MKRWTCILCLIAVAAMTALPAQDKAPVIAFESQSRDFGRVIEGTLLTHVFKFVNKGSSTLEIIKVEAG